MNNPTRKWDRLSQDRKQEVINDMIVFFESERDEKIGVIAAQEILDFVLKSVSNDIYNKGITDAKAALENRFDEFKYDLEDLLDL